MAAERQTDAHAGARASQSPAGGEVLRASARFFRQSRGRSKLWRRGNSKRKQVQDSTSLRPVRCIQKRQPPRRRRPHQSAGASGSNGPADRRERRLLSNEDVHIFSGPFCTLAAFAGQAPLSPGYYVCEAMEGNTSYFSDIFLGPGDADAVSKAFAQMLAAKLSSSSGRVSCPLAFKTDATLKSLRDQHKPYAAQRAQQGRKPWRPAGRTAARPSLVLDHCRSSPVATNCGPRQVCIATKPLPATWFTTRRQNLMRRTSTRTASTWASRISSPRPMGSAPRRNVLPPTRSPTATSSRPPVSPRSTSYRGLGRR